VRLNHLIKYLNRAIAVVVILAGCGVWWVAWRPLPQNSGTITGGVAQRVTVSFDRLGEPHIAATNQDDLLFAQGYLTAQERMWQMDALRRLAGGDLCEIVGAAALESDEEVRRLRMRRIAEEAAVSMPADDRA
jgi:penicillin amidase